MRILAIRGRNLASLARAFEVDLVRGPLAGVGLFAITGPVGAGKSTLLDAMCLPLFDKTPRLRGRGGLPVGDAGDDPEAWLNANDPRTLLRRDAVEGHAEVDFTGRDGGRYRARWSVRRARRKADGRVQEQELSLHDLDRGVAVASGRRTEVLAAVQQRLGLDFEQFCRSVLLAQGDFAAFLKASADERAKLLETLTGADVYRRLSKAAHERRRHEEQGLAVMRSLLDAQQPLAADARAELERQSAHCTAQLATCEVAIELAGRYVQWHAVAERQAAAEAEAVLALQRAIEADRAAEVERATLRRVQAARAVVPRLEIARDTAARARRMAVAARQAQDAVAHAVVAHDAATQAWQRAFTTVFGAFAPVAAPLLRDAATWQPLLAQWRAATRELAQLAAQEASLQQAVARTGQQLVLGEQALATAQRERADAAAALATAQRELDAFDAEALAAERQACTTQRAAAERSVRAAHDWQTATTDLQACEQRRSDLAQRTAAQRVAVQHAVDRRTAALTTHATWQRESERTRQHHDLAGLRAQLVAGEPCPLCGAADHDTAALPDQELAAVQRELAQAQRALDAATQVAAQAGAELGALARESQRAEHEAELATARLAAARSAFGAGASTAAEAMALAMRERAAVAAAEQALRAREAARDAAMARVRSVLARDQSAQAALQTATAQHVAALAAQRAAHDGAQSWQREREHAAQRLAAATVALGPACDGLPGGAEALPRLLQGAPMPLASLLTVWRVVPERAEARAVAEQAAERAARDQQAMDAEAATAAAQYERACLDAGVGPDDVQTAAALSLETLREREAVVTALRAAVERGRAVVGERAEQRRQHESHDRPSLDAADAAQALRDAQDSKRTATAGLDQVRLALQSDDLVRRHRDELAPRLAAAERALETWATLDDLIGSSAGDAFAVFAQGLTLDLLLGEANRRLQALAPRYRLQRSRAGELDFVVVDLDLGGSVRAVQTLSGGETFLVSLALALALATLAAPRSRIETLFLDEGFGTLDAQSLEVALGALDALQAAGCQVGVISHVDGIAERIGAQVVVQPEGTGQSRVLARVR